MSHIIVNKSPLGDNPRGIKGIVSSSHYVCGEYVVATNGLVLLENVEEHIHFQQIFADTAMGGEPSLVLQFFQHNVAMGSLTLRP